MTPIGWLLVFCCIGSFAVIVVWTREAWMEIDNDLDLHE